MDLQVTSPGPECSPNFWETLNGQREGRVVDLRGVTDCVALGSGPAAAAATADKSGRSRVQTGWSHPLTHRDVFERTTAYLIAEAEADWRGPEPALATIAALGRTHPALARQMRRLGRPDAERLDRLDALATRRRQRRLRYGDILIEGRVVGDVRLGPPVQVPGHL